MDNANKQYSEKTYKSSVKYKDLNIKRVPLDMQLTQYDQLKSAATSLGEPVNTFIKTAIAERLQKLNNK